MYEFKKEIPAEVYSMILENVLILMSSAAREILKATVSFLITLTKGRFSTRDRRRGAESDQKNGKFLHEENIPIIREIEKPKLSVYFRFARTSQFLTRDVATLNSTLSMSHRPRPLAAGPIRNAETWNRS